MWLVSSELISPSGYLPLEGRNIEIDRVACMMEGKTLIGRVLSSSVC